MRLIRWRMEGRTIIITVTLLFTSYDVHIFLKGYGHRKTTLHCTFHYPAPNYCHVVWSLQYIFPHGRYIICSFSFFKEFGFAGRQQTWIFASDFLQWVGSSAWDITLPEKCHPDITDASQISLTVHTTNNDFCFFQYSWWHSLTVPKLSNCRQKRFGSFHNLQWLNFGYEGGCIIAPCECMKGKQYRT